MLLLLFVSIEVLLGYALFSLNTFFNVARIKSISSSVEDNGGLSVKILLWPATVSPFLPIISPLALHSAISLPTRSFDPGSFVSLSSTISIPASKPRPRTSPTYGYASSSFNPVNSRFPCRSEEHTSELQSRGHLVCRL